MEAGQHAFNLGLKIAGSRYPNPRQGVCCVSLRLSAGKALDFNSRVTGNIVEFLALAE